MLTAGTLLRSSPHRLLCKIPKAWWFPQIDRGRKHKLEVRPFFFLRTHRNSNTRVNTAKTQLTSTRGQVCPKLLCPEYNPGDAFRSLQLVMLGGELHRCREQEVMARLNELHVGAQTYQTPFGEFVGVPSMFERHVLNSEPVSWRSWLLRCVVAHSMAVP